MSPRRWINCARCPDDRRRRRRRPQRQTRVAAGVAARRSGDRRLPSRHPPTRPTDRIPEALAGRPWTLADIVDYELIATMALLDTVADRREALLQQIYAVNRETIEMGQKGDPAAILIPVETQHDPGEAVHLVERLQMAGVEVYRSGAAFNADARSYAAGTFVIPMDQVFARYAKDMLEKQTYPEVRRSPSSAPEPPYDVTAWSLGMLLGVDHVVVGKPIGAEARLQKLTGAPSLEGRVSGNGVSLRVRLSRTRRREGDQSSAEGWWPRVVRRGRLPAIRAGREPGWPNVRANRRRRRLRALGLQDQGDRCCTPGQRDAACRAPRIGMYQPWTGGNMDEGWTRWVLEQYSSHPRRFTTTDVRAGKLREQVRRHHPARPGRRAPFRRTVGPRPSVRSNGAASVKRASTNLTRVRRRREAR